MNQQLRDRSAIAVVGMALRVPGANTPERFWQNVISGEDCLTRFSTEDLRKAGVSKKKLADPRLVATSPVLRGFESFDATFFDLTPMEVEWTDPAHRVFLECSWEAMERAGIAPGPGAPVTGVFAGVGARAGNSYLARNLSKRAGGLEEPSLSVMARVGNSCPRAFRTTSIWLGPASPCRPLARPH
jgi:acyl transferase domain-containing protein